MKLWLARHAQPLIESGVCYGATDVAADALATRSAAQTLAQVLPQGLAVLSSPLQRCTHLARCLQNLRPDLAFTTEARLAEMNFGCWEGQRWDAIPKAAFDCWTADFAHHRFGGQESVQEFMQRVASVWMQATQPGQDVVWITHAGVIRAATLLAQGVCQIETAQQWPHDAPALGGWVALQV